MATYYHACKESTWQKILDSGEVRKSWDGCVYLCKAPEEAARFIALRLMFEEEKTIIVLEFEDTLDESKIEEVFDHNESFWKCRCWGYLDNIPTYDITNVYEYEAR